MRVGRRHSVVICHLLSLESPHTGGLRLSIAPCTCTRHQLGTALNIDTNYKLNCLHCPVALITSCKYPTALSCLCSKMFVSNICSCGRQLPIGRTNTEPRINRKINRWLDYSVGSNGEFHYKSDGKITLHL